MLVIEKTALREAMAAMVTALHGCSDPHFAHTMIRTVDDLLLKNATLAMLSILAGDAVIAE